MENDEIFMLRDEVNELQRRLSDLADVNEKLHDEADDANREKECLEEELVDKDRKINELQDALSNIEHIARSV